LLDGNYTAIFSGDYGEYSPNPLNSNPSSRSPCDSSVVLHVLCTDGCFYGQGMFRVAPRFETKQLEEVFRHNVFKMLLSKEKITEELIDMPINGAIRDLMLLLL
jgi:hypothetical protein